MKSVSAKRRSLKSLSSAFIMSGVISLGGISFPAHAIWQEVARAIATGIAEFARRSFEALTEFWKEVQKASNDKISQVKTGAQDQLNDFKISVENKKRQIAARPLEKQCIEGVVNDEIRYKAANEANLAIQKATFSGVTGNNFNPESGRRNSGLFANESLSAQEIINHVAETLEDKKKGEPLSQAKVAAQAELLMANSLHITSEIPHKLGTAEAIRTNPQMALAARRANASIATLSLVTHIYTSNQSVEDGRVGVHKTIKDKLVSLEEDMANEGLSQQMAMSLNDVALAAELVKQVGEQIYLDALKYHENEKLISTLALLVLELRARRGGDV